MKEPIVQLSLLADQELTMLEISYSSPLPIEQQYYYLSCLQQLLDKQLQAMENQATSHTKSSSQA